MLLAAGSKLSCSGLGVIIDEYGGEKNKYRVLEIGGNACSVSYSECWSVSDDDPKGYRYGLRCACSKFNYEEAVMIASIIASKIPSVRLIVITPIPFLFPWGPLNIIDMPIKELWISTSLSAEDEAVDEICSAALSSINDLVPLLIYTHPAGCIDILKDIASGLLDLIKKQAILGDVLHEVRGDWAILRFGANVNYCKMVEKLSHLVRNTASSL